jgi:putative Ig domain-containing protein/Big-like domain-containing protein
MPDANEMFIGVITDYSFSDARLIKSNAADGIGVDEIYYALSNQAPSINYLDDQEVLENELLEFVVSAADPDGDDLTFSSETLPDGATLTPIDETSALFSWTPNFDQAGIYEVDFSVTDDQAVDTMVITIHVGNNNLPPEFTFIDEQTVNEEELLEFIVTADDPDGDNFVLSAEALPSGASFDPVTGIFSWTPDLNQSGTYVVAFYALDDGVEPAESELEVIVVVGDVPTPTETIDSMTIYIEELDLPPNVATSSVIILNVTNKFIERGNVWLSEKFLHLFIEKIERDVAQGKIDPEVAQILIDDAYYIIESFG